MSTAQPFPEMGFRGKSRAAAIFWKRRTPLGKSARERVNIGNRIKYACITCMIAGF
jgi:hypothetical protein